MLWGDTACLSDPRPPGDPPQPPPRAGDTLCPLCPGWDGLSWVTQEPKPLLAFVILAVSRAGGQQWV